ncbi:MAG: hypothetical protein QOI41_7488 [Myxococcales bacterium]|jgi:hypothetical protein|nr:hypothetical protein [Myxococcales bacterium]
MKTMMNRSTLRFVACCLPLVAFGCNKTGAEAQREADNARVEANTKTTGAQVEADTKIADAQKAFAKTREDYRHDVQTKLDDLDKKIADLDAKAKKGTGTTKAKLDTNLPSIHSQRNAFARDFASVETDTALTWDASKARLDKEWTALKDAVDKAD